LSELRPLLNIDASCGAQEDSAGVRGVLVWWDCLASGAVFLPWLVTGYWILHIIGHPNLCPLLLALLVILVVVSGRSAISAPSRAAFGIGGSTLAAVLLALILVPALANAGMTAKAVAFHPLATDFIYPDDAFDLLIARGLEHGYPPPDLSYRGEIVQYHYGLPLLIEFMHRLTGLSPHVTLYGILPGLLSILTLLSLYRIFRLLFPDWTINRLLVGILLSQAVIFIDVYNLGWHIRDLMHSGSLADLSFMPIAAIYAAPVLTDGYGSQGMAVVLLLVLFANIDRCGPFAAGCMLFAIYLTKQQVFLPLALAWGVVGLAAWARERNVRTLGGLALATALVVVSKSAVPFEAGFALRPAFNDYFIGLGRVPSRLAPVLLSTPVAAYLVVAVSFVLGTHIYGPALYATYYRNRSKLLTAGKKIVLLVETYFLSAIAILVGTVLVMKPAVEARWDAIHEIVANQLRLPEATLFPRDRADMMNMSLAAVLAPCEALISALATGAILQWHNTTLARRWSVVLSVFCMLAIGFVGYSWTQLPAWQPPTWWHVIDDSEIEALKAAKDDPGTIFTNDLRLQPAGRVLTLLNIAAPQLFGQQFYASNFWFGNFAYPDVLDRLHAHEWFWSTPLGDHHRSFLTENDIKYLLIRRDMPFPREILSVPWVNVVLQNRDYYLLRVIEGYGET
jgi:hypothetical protein